MKLKAIILFLLFWNTYFYSQKVVQTIIDTSLGTIELELYADKAPVTVANFLKYIEHNLYDNATFFRVCTPENEVERAIKIEVIQGGDISKEKLFPPISIETTQQTGLLHTNGTISMARGAPNSAQSNFFICINNQPELDFNGKRNPDGQGFAAFGKVTNGMDVVLSIQSGKNSHQILSKPIRIKTIKIID